MRHGIFPALAALVLALSALALPAGAEVATKVGPAHLPSCGPGGFIDIKGDCWRCPGGFKHDNVLLPPTDPKVCKKTGTTDLRAGTRIGASTVGYCKSGWLSLHDGGCYTCPQGYSHDGTKSGNKIGVCYRKSADTFATASRLAGNLVCQSGFFDPIDNGSCWTCPASAPVRTIHSVKSDMACDGLRVVRSGAADAILKPGDVMFKLLDRKSEASSFGVAISQIALKELEHRFEGAHASGDAAAVHVAVYLGDNRTAEAYGGITDAAVGTRPLSDHAGFLFYVFRFNDQALAHEAVQVATLWANRRMKYLMPTHVPVAKSEFSIFAQADALRYGVDAGRAGGPRNDDKMFCSQFAIAIYQAAAVRRQFEKLPQLKDSQVSVPQGVKVHAVNTSPLTLHSKMKQAAEQSNPEMTYLGRVLVQK